MLKKTVIAFSFALLTSSQSSYAMAKIDDDEVKNPILHNNSLPIRHEGGIEAPIRTSLQSSQEAIAHSLALLSLQTSSVMQKQEIENSTLAKSSQQIYHEKVRNDLFNGLQSAQTAITDYLILLSSENSFHQKTDTSTTLRSLPALPLEVWRQILSYLNLDALRLSTVSHAWNKQTLLSVNTLVIDADSKVTDRQIKKFANLTLLDIKKGYIISDEGIRNLFNLTSLSLPQCGGGISDQSVSCFTNLTWLNLEDYYGNITDKSTICLTNLVYLNIPSYLGNITDLSISTLTNLKQLNLKSNKKITDRGISQLTNLTWLNLDHNNLISDKGLFPLVNIKDLSLKCNDSITIKSVVNLTKIQTLWGFGCHTSIKRAPLSHVTNFDTKSYYPD